MILKGVAISGELFVTNNGIYIHTDVRITTICDARFVQCASIWSEASPQWSSKDK